MAAGARAVMVDVGVVASVALVPAVPVAAAAPVQEGRLGGMWDGCH